VRPRDLDRDRGDDQHDQHVERDDAVKLGRAQHHPDERDQAGGREQRQ